jgi:predicted esterase
MNWEEDMPDQRLEQAMQLVKAGKVEEARQVLELVIRDDRHDIVAWQFYAETWPKPKDKLRVWEVCLRYNPMNPQAQQALALLQSGQPKRSDTQPKADMTSPAGAATREPARSSAWVVWMGMGLLVALLVFVIVVVRQSAPKEPAAYRHSEPVEYYLYVPETYSADKEWPLFVGIHGAGGNGIDCWNLWQSYAEAEGFILLCPSITGDSSGFYQDVGENTVWSAIGEVQKEYRVKQQMFFSGFSAGAFFIQGFTYHYPQYVSGLSILSAGVYLNPRMFINLVPMLVVIGGADNPDAVQTSQIFVSNLQKFGFDIQYAVLPNVGHTVTQEGINMTIELFRRTMGN